MRIISAGALTALGGGAVSIAQLVDMALTVPLRLNTSSWDLTWAGNVYTGVAGVGRIDSIDDEPGEMKGLRFELSAVPTDMISIALQEPVQGKLVTIRTAVFDANAQIIDAPVEWLGRLDTMTIAEQGPASIVQVSAEHIGIDLLRPGTLNFSHADQRRLFPGDRGFEYLIDQADQIIVWPAASYFRRN